MVGVRRKNLSFYFTPNGIATDAKKRVILLSSVGPTTFRLMRSLVLPNSLDTCSRDQSERPQGADTFGNCQAFSI